MKFFWALLATVLFSAILCSASNPVPMLYQPLAPTVVVPGHAGFTLTVSGTGFMSGAVVMWNGNSLPTTFVSGRKLRASVPATNVLHATSAAITVSDPGVRVASNPVYFLVRKPEDTTPALHESALPTQNTPAGIAAGDLNGDGLPDLVTTNELPGTVSVLLNNGNGTFQPHKDYVTGTNPVAIAIGDFNGDGAPDLALSSSGANGVGGVSILLGAGDGTFLAPTIHPTRGPIFCISVADFNGDGNLDLAVSNELRNGFSVLLGNGDGTFQPHMDFATDQSLPCLSVGDFNGDGKLDIVAVNTLGFSIYLGNGDGTFRAGSSYEVVPAQTPHSAAVADFNGDGNLDLAIVTQLGIDGQGSIVIFTGDGAGNFQRGQTLYPDSICPNSLTLGDFNGDGFLDLASNDPCGSVVSVETGDGTGRFTITPYRPANGAGGPIVTADFNGDGRLDLALPEGNWGLNAVDLLLQK